MRKRLLAVLAVVAMAALAVYGSTKEMSGIGEEESRFSWFGKADKETIYFWYTDATLTDYVNSAAVSFGEKEDVRVIPVLTSNNEYLEAVNKASVGNTQLPDVYLVSHDSLEKAYMAGLACEVQDNAGICNTDTFPQGALDAVTYKGKIVGYPMFYETSALVYNQTYLNEWARQQAMKELTGAESEEESESVEEEDVTAVDETLLIQKMQEYLPQAIPQTVAGILNVADTFDVPEGVEGIMSWDVSDIFYNYWVVGQYMIVGGNAGDDITQINIANEETIQCLEVYKALNQFFSIVSDTITYESVLQDFIQGKTVFTIVTTDAAKYLEAAKAEGLMTFDYGFAPMPDISDELQSRSMSVTNVVAVNGYSTQKELANKFAAYLTGEYAGKLYERTGKMSSKLSTTGGDAVLQAFMEEYSHSIPLPKMMETGNFWLQLEVLFAKVWNGADVTASLQELAEQMKIQIGG